MAASIQRFGGKFQILKKGRSWVQCLARFSSSDKSKDGEHKMEAEDLPNPVRNTEKEYFDRIRNPNRDFASEPGPFDSKYYSRKQGITKELFSWLHWDFNINDTEDIAAFLKKKRYEHLKDSQRYLQERHDALGPELAGAHFVLAQGGAVKFWNRDTWIRKDAQGRYSLPRSYVENLYVEAIDVSNTDFTYVAFDNIGQLSQLRYLNLSKCKYIDDWSLARLQRLSHSLEFLDISDCPRVTDWGLASLQCLRKMQGLRVVNLPGVKFLGLLTLLLEEQVPGLKMLGVTEADLQPPAFLQRGERRLVRALLGMMDKDKSDPDEERMEFSGQYSHDGFHKYNRAIRKVDW
ncbi:distal membrane-arm assembly complex protein 2 [Aplysia californica]|uniref:Distal membrane-arm assembly complex protein 2 n=1 Tax=Aplysia californica TaxID=6500 RepID=A0ABM0JAE7_APLCA|nr:distal membrane-arm assembly complex protein 2 [Aplysia californica]